MPQGKNMEITQLRAICNDFALGYSYNSIKNKRNPVAKSTLQKIKEKLQIGGLLDIDKLQKTSDEDLVILMYGVKSHLEKKPGSNSCEIVIDRTAADRIDNSRMHPAHFEDLIIRFEDNRHLTKEDLYRDYVDEAIKAGHEYYKRTAFMTRFNALIKNRKGPDVYMHREHIMGDELQMDWLGPKFEVRIGARGETRACSVIVFVWAASNYVYAQLVPDMTTRTTCDAIRNALISFNCLPRRLVIDNQSCLVNKHGKGQEGILNASFEYFCKRCGIGIDANNPYCSNEKSAAENSVRLVEQRVLTRLEYARGVFTIDECNREIIKLVNTYINNTSYRGGGVKDTRGNIFRNKELPASLRIDSPLPNFIEHHAFLKVGKDYHIKLNEASYSVPWKYAEQYVNADIEGNQITIYDFNHLNILARHPVKNKGEWSTMKEHMPESHKAVKTKELVYQDKSDIREAAMSISTSLASFCEFMLNRGNWFEDKKACIHIINLYKRNFRKKLIYDQAIQKLLHLSNPVLINSYELKKIIKEYEKYASTHNGALPIQTDLFDSIGTSIDADCNAACLRGASGFSDLNAKFNEPAVTSDATKANSNNQNSILEE